MQGSNTYFLNGLTGVTIADDQGDLVYPLLSAASELPAGRIDGSHTFFLCRAYSQRYDGRSQGSSVMIPRSPRNSEFYSNRWKRYRSPSIDLVLDTMADPRGPAYEIMPGSVLRKFFPAD